MPNTTLVLDDNYARHFRALGSFTMDEFSVGIPGKITHLFNFIYPARVTSKRRLLRQTRKLRLYCATPGLRFAHGHRYA